MRYYHAVIVFLKSARSELGVPLKNQMSPCGHQAARCDCCKVQGNLTESVMWRAEMKHFCDQECLLKFYCQQNEPIMVTQKGPENTTVGTKS